MINGTTFRLILYISDASSISLYIPSRLCCACFNFNPRLRYQLGARVLHIWNTRITLPLNTLIHLPSLLHSPSVTAPPAWTLLSNLPISPATLLISAAYCQHRFGMAWPLIPEGPPVVRPFKPPNIAIWTLRTFHVVPRATRTAESAAWLIKRQLATQFMMW